MENTWAARDLPVLEAIVEWLDASYGTSQPELSDIAQKTGLDVTAVARAAVALEGDDLITLQRPVGGPDSWFVSQVSGRARQRVGQWPSAEQFVDALAQRLETAAEEETSTERQTRLKELARSSKTSARDIFVGVAASVISKRMGA